jgi:lysophospholipase L1-like esterase
VCTVGPMGLITRGTDAALLAAAPLVRRLLWPAKAMRRAQFEQLPLPAGRVLFLGDSITEQGLWHEWFPELPTLNRGISGDTVGEVRARLDSAVRAPSAISLLVGTNDLSGLGPSRDVVKIAQEFRGLVEDLRRRAPDTHLIVNSVMPRKATFASQVRALNHEYAAIAREAGATWVDLWPVLADGADSLKAQYTGDSLHLNGAGYAVWVEALRPLLASG